MPPPPPELSDDLLGEVFLRLPPDDPACLLRASLACKRWRRVLADPTFRRRHRELHPMPSVLGFLRHAEGDTPNASRFVSNNPAYGRPAARDLPGRVALDCRHGRVLLRAPSPLLGTNLNYDFVVWDPLTTEQRCLPRLSPPLTDVSRHYFNAAVLCSAAMEGCDHTMCHGGPFRVAFIWSHAGQLHARAYSSETDNWSEAISVQEPRPRPSILRLPLYLVPCLVGDTLYFHYTLYHALEYQLGAQRLSIIKGPPQPVSQKRSFLVMPMGDGGLGCMTIEEDESSLLLQLWSREAASDSDEVAWPVSQLCSFFVMPMGDSGLGCMAIEEDESSLHLQLWSREAALDSDEFVGWTRGRAIDLEALLPNGALPSPRLLYVPHTRFRSVSLLGFVEDTDVIFVGTHARIHPGGIYMVQLNSRRASKVSAFDNGPVPFYNKIVIPYTSFCIPVTDASSSSATTGPGGNASGA